MQSCVSFSLLPFPRFQTYPLSRVTELCQGAEPTAPRLFLRSTCARGHRHRLIRDIDYSYSLCNLTRVFYFAPSECFTFYPSHQGTYREWWVGTRTPCKPCLCRLCPPGCRLLRFAAFRLTWIINCLNYHSLLRISASQRTILNIIQYTIF
jgi:hypothetical protein